MNRTARLLRLAIARGDRVAELVIRARIASQPWRPQLEPTSIWTRRLGRVA